MKKLFQNKFLRWLIAFILFIIGLIFSFKSLIFITILFPFFLIAFILSIILLFRHQIKTGLILLLISIICPILYLSAHTYASMMILEMSRKTNTSYNKQYILITEEEIIFEGDHQFCSGRITNSGPTRITELKIKVELFDEFMNILDIDYLYPLNNGSIGPNESISFKSLLIFDKRIIGVRYIIVE